MNIATIVFLDDLREELIGVKRRLTKQNYGSAHDTLEVIIDRVRQATTGLDMDRIEADERLRDAAPEMLEALEYIARKISEVESLYAARDDRWDEFLHLRNTAKQAIAKAKGETGGGQ